MEIVGLVGTHCRSTHSSPRIVDQCSDIIYRKTDADTLTFPSSYELLLSYTYDAFDTPSSRILGFYKGAQSTTIIEHLRESAQEILHPMLLPIIIASNIVGPSQEKHQRDTRVALRDVEEALCGQMWSYVPVTMSLNEINAHLVSYHSKVWKNPGASRKIIDSMQKILQDISHGHYYTDKQSPGRHLRDTQAVLLQEINERYMNKAAFIRKRLRGIEIYCHATLSKIDMDRTAFHNILLNRNNETALQIEQRQRLEAERKFVANQT
jgi:hypothetical protein